MPTDRPEGTNDSEKLHLEVDKLVARGKHAKAERKLRAAIAENSDDWYSYYLLGSVLQGLGRGMEAANVYAKALERNPEDLRLKYVAAQLYVAIGQPEISIAMLEEAIDQRPESSNAQALYGKALIDLGEFKKAEAALELALRQSEDHPDARAEMVRLYEFSGQYDLIEPFLSSYLATAPELPSSYVLMADYLFYELGDCVAALDAYEEGLRLYDGSENKRWFKQFFSTAAYPTLIRRGYLNALLACDLEDSALAYAARYPGNGQFEAFQAQVFERQGKLDAALKQIKKALKREPSEYEWTYQLGRVHLAKREFEVAQELMLKAVRAAREQGDMDAWIDGGVVVCLDMLGRASEAESLQVEVTGIRVYRLLASLADHYSLIEEWDKVIQVSQEILLDDNDDVNGTKTLAKALLESGDLDSAIEAQSKLVELQPRNGRHLISLAKAHDMSGDAEAAASALRAAIESGTLSEPQLKSVKSQLAHLGTI